MTEQDWLNSTDSHAMLESLRGSGKAGGRKLRLFAVGCCRRVDGCLTRETRTLMEVAERVAEGTADEGERRTPRAAAMRAGWHPDQITRHARGPAKAAVFRALARRPFEAALNAASYALSAA